MNLEKFLYQELQSVLKVLKKLVKVEFYCL